MSGANNATFLDAVKARRSYYAINKEAPVPDSRVTEIVETAMLSVPSAYNTQPIRTVVLLNEDHSQFWENASEATKNGPLPPDTAKYMISRITGFEAGSGSILFWTDEHQVQKDQADHAQLAHFFPGWTEQSQGMHQYVLWAALEAEGFGASLQHYQFLGPDFVQSIRDKYDVPKEWSLVAQLVFGGRVNNNVKDKQLKPLSETIKVFGAK